MHDRYSDYNYCCNGLAPALRPYIEREDLKTLAMLADSLQEKEEVANSDIDTLAGFTVGVATLLEEMDIPDIRDAFLPSSECSAIPRVRAAVLCNVARSRYSTESLQLAADLLLRDVKRAAVSIYFIGAFSKPEHNLSWGSFGGEHVTRLIALTLDKSEEVWALRALSCICAARPDLANLVQLEASKSDGLILRAALLHCVTRTSKPVFDALSVFACMTADQRLREPTHLLDEIELDWAGHEQLLVRLLRLRDTDLALSLIEPLAMGDSEIGQLEIGEIDWWLDWLEYEHSPQKRWMLHDRISRLFEESTSLEVRNEFVDEFNKPDSKFRRVLADSILLARSDLTTDSFSEDAISFLLARLKAQEIGDSFSMHLLGNTATEAFVAERLMPFLIEAQEPFATNLRLILRQAGSRHGRRYVV